MIQKKQARKSMSNNADTLLTIYDYVPYIQVMINETIQ